MLDKNQFEPVNQNKVHQEKTHKEEIIIHHISKTKLIMITMLSLILPMFGYYYFIKFRDLHKKEAKLPLIAMIISVCFGYTFILYLLFIR